MPTIGRKNVRQLVRNVSARDSQYLPTLLRIAADVPVPVAIDIIHELTQVFIHCLHGPLWIPCFDRVNDSLVIFYKTSADNASHGGNDQTISFVTAKQRY